MSTKTTKRDGRGGAAPTPNIRARGDANSLYSIEQVAVRDLVPDPRNARVHNERNIMAVARSMEQFGQHAPLVVQRQGMIVRVGNARLAAAIQLGWKHVACMIVDEDDATALARAVADNRTAELAGWNTDYLVEILTELRANQSVDHLVAGFTDIEIDDLIGETKEPITEPEPIPIPKGKPVSRVGDTWLLDNHRLYVGDVVQRITELEDESVQCVVTSPPYWGLRDYGTAEWEGGKKGCDHSTARSRGDDIKSKDKQGTSKGSRPNTQTVCGKCGAKRIDSQLGMEATPGEHVENIVGVFREVRRVLRKDGTLWLNYGDSYVNAGCDNTKVGGFSGASARKFKATGKGGGSKQGSFDKRGGGLDSKNLVGMPWRVAFALQEDGWILRSDIIWHKPNPMPESVTDRPTKSHEYLFLLAKSTRYRFNADAVREDVSPHNTGVVSVSPHGDHVKDTGHSANVTRRYDEIKGANIRDVWTIPTQPTPEAHFATFPMKLVTPCLLAGTCPDATVLDPFGGSGTVMLVCETLGKLNAVSFELNPLYADIAIRRWQEETAKQAVLDGTGKTFDDVKKRRPRKKKGN